MLASVKIVRMQELKKMTEQVLRLSWSTIGSFMKCQRRFQLEYVAGLSRLQDSDSSALIIGSFVHAGWQAALWGHFLGNDVKEQHHVLSAYAGLRGFNTTGRDDNRKKWNYEVGAFEPDYGYIATWDDAFDTAKDMIDYYVPRFDWERYRVASVADVLPNADEKVLKALGITINKTAADTPLIELKFEIPFERTDGTQFTLSGIIDAVLWDEQQHEFVVLDWKTRSNMPDPIEVQLDGQLPLYATVLNTLGANIHRAIMYQIATKIPKPAQLTTKGEISKAAPASTWSYWAASVRALGKDPDKYIDEMLPKMRPDTDWTDIQQVAVTAGSQEAALENLFEVVDAIVVAKEANRFPAVLAAGYTSPCGFCPFKKICVVYQAGGDTQPVIEKEFVYNKHRPVPD